MIGIEPHFGNPTMYYSANIMAASTNHFLDDRTDFEDLKEFVANGSKYIASMTSGASAAPEKVNEAIAVVQGANRALMLRSIMRSVIMDVDAFAQDALSDDAPAPKSKAKSKN